MRKDRPDSGSTPAHASAAHYLVAVVHRNSGSNTIAGNRWQFMNGVSLPEHSLVVEYLWCNAVWILRRVLCESCDQSTVVCPGGSTVVAAQRSERLHETLSPPEPAARSIAAVADSPAGVAVESAEGLSQGINR